MRSIDDERILALLLRPDASIREAMERIDEGAFEIALVVDDERRLRGTVSDGDVRRALLGGAAMDDPVAPYVSEQPVTVRPDAGRAAALDLMRARTISQVPEVDRDGRLRGLHLLHEVIGAPTLDMWAVVLAGGRGTRLGNLTDERPKPMLEVAGRPILERIVLHLVGSGIRRIVLSVGYLGEQIEEHFGDGSAFGCEISYLREDPDRPLGTGGPLRLLLEQDEQDEQPDGPLLVMNGDLVTSFSVAGLLRAHEGGGAAMTLGVREYVHDVPFGVVRFDEHDDGAVTAIDEKPTWAWPVNAGIYVVEPALLERIPAHRHYPITELAYDCLARGDRLQGWRVDGDWQDIGRPSELAAARGVT